MIWIEHRLQMLKARRAAVKTHGSRWMPDVIKQQQEEIALLDARIEELENICLDTHGDIRSKLEEIPTLCIDIA